MKGCYGNKKIRTRIRREACIGAAETLQTRFVPLALVLREEFRLFSDAFVPVIIEHRIFRIDDPSLSPIVR